MPVPPAIKVELALNLTSELLVDVFRKKQF